MILGKQKGFSLTELLIVIVVIALLFAAMAPIVTKRHVAQTSESESIWNFVSNDAERNSYFDPGTETWTSSVYVGYIPTTSNANSGKLVINSGDISYNNGSGITTTYKQPQMQFRFSADPTQQGRGQNAANLLLYSGNALYGIDSSLISGNKNTIYGISNLSGEEKDDGTSIKITKSQNSTIFGSQAMHSAKLTESNAQHYITAFGSRAAYRLGSIDSTTPVSGIYIGAGAGSGGAENTAAPNANIAIGYNSMSNDGTGGFHNVFLGALTGNGFTDTAASYNTIVGSSFSAVNSDAAYNTIIGYGVYARGDKNIHNMTAIGFGSCGSISGNNSGHRICLGYNSAYNTNNTPASFSSDNGEHIFIGGIPRSDNTIGFAGRAVLEVHNTKSSNADGSVANVGNVVLNSNLVVRGNFYPSDDNGNVQYNVFTDTKTIGAERVYSRCSSDRYGYILSYHGYLCTGLTDSNPKSVNVLQKGGNCSASDGYPNGNGCPNIATSDIRLKTDIVENNDGLDKILKLEPYKYTYKADNLKIPQVGVIAQDLKKVFPNSVTKDENGFYNIRWDEMFFSLINSVKSLISKLEDISQKLSYIEYGIKNEKLKQKDIQKKISELSHRVDRLERK